MQCTPETEWIVPVIIVRIWEDVVRAVWHSAQSRWDGNRVFDHTSIRCRRRGIGRNYQITSTGWNWIWNKIVFFLIGNMFNCSTSTCTTTLHLQVVTTSRIQTAYDYVRRCKKYMVRTSTTWTFASYTRADFGQAGRGNLYQACHADAAVWWHTVCMYVYVHKVQVVRNICLACACERQTAASHKRVLNRVHNSNSIPHKQQTLD